MIPDNAIGTAWIDDIEVYKIDTETGERVGSNLLTNTDGKQYGFFDEAGDAVDKAEIDNDGNVNQEVSATVSTEGADKVKAFFWNDMSPWAGQMGTTVSNTETEYITIFIRAELLQEQMKVMFLV